jgi:hypothetical protein
MGYELVTSREYLSSVLAGSLLEVYGQVEPIEVTDAPDPGPRRVPRDIRLWLARLRLLEAVPFSHLVADATLLPTESIRFFHLDRGWTDSLVEGALSVGTVTTSDRAALETLYPSSATRWTRPSGWSDCPAGSRARPSERQRGPGHRLPAAVAHGVGLAALHVRAYGKDNLAVDPKISDRDVDETDDTTLSRLPMLRMERLARRCCWS